MERVLNERTRYLTLVMEDIHKPHNANAVLRTADCFGIQDIHYIEETTPYQHSQKISRGATKWLTLHQYHQPNGGSTAQCMQALKSKGYQIIATSPAATSVGVDHIPLDRPTAVLFGTEWFGTSQYALDHADGFIKLPMYGFTESYNISVAAALTVQLLVQKLRRTQVNWSLSEDEKAVLRLKWYQQSVKRPDIMEKAFLAKSDLT